MSVVKYLCEFFFGNYWHFLGLCLMLVLLCPWNCITINEPDDEKEKGDKK